MALFVRIVESGSLSAAGRALAMPKATISRRLGLLEQRLGAPLLRRSTRALTTTDFGQRYFERAQPIVHEALQAQSEAEAEHTEPSGLVRVSAPNSFGQAVLAPKMFEFLNQHPAVRIDLKLSDERQPIVAGGFDLAIRMGALDDSDLVARRLATVAMRLVASPGYLAKNGEPQTAAELAHHVAVLTRADLDQWHIGDQTVRMRWGFSTGSMMLTRDAVTCGLGIGLLPAFLAEEAIRSGTLTELLIDQPLVGGDVNALWPRNRTPSLAVSTLVNYLATGFQSTAPL